jgi:hypothetical protein
MTEVGELMGVQMSCLLSPMDEPLGRTVGNALEVAECVEILQGGGPADSITLILDLAQKVSTSRAISCSMARREGRVAEVRAAGRAQRGSAEVRRIRASIVRRVFARSSRARRNDLEMDAEAIVARPSMLGAGRQRAEDASTSRVAFPSKKVGESGGKVNRDVIHARTKRAFDPCCLCSRAASCDLIMRRFYVMLRARCVRCLSCERRHQTPRRSLRPPHHPVAAARERRAEPGAVQRCDLLRDRQEGARC